ncbi:MAG: S66 family peptidase [Fimbriimonas sp.]
MRKVAALRPGDRVAAVSDSWGGAATFPHRYQAGVDQMREAFGLEVVPMAHTFRDADWLLANPEARAHDLMQAFSDPTIRGVFSVIGGDESIRILPYLDLDVLAQTPKVFIGFSDTTVMHFALLKAGVPSFYGPSIMAGFAENGGMFPYLVDSVRVNLFSSTPVGIVSPNADTWTVEHLDWSNPENQLKIRKRNRAEPWRWMQGTSRVEGKLLGGCLEVLDWLRGSLIWPSPEQGRGSILFLETSEEKPSPGAVARMLRSLHAAGMFEECAALLMGRPCTDSPEAMDAQDAAVLGFVRDELRRPDLPVVTRMDFGHTSPVFTIPLGVLAEIDCPGKTFSILEMAVTSEDR